MRTTMLLTTALCLLGAALITAQNEQTEARFSARSELVVLNVAVTDRGGFVGGLSADAFRVFEDGTPQKVSFFAEQDAPATVGLLIDSSGSMLVSKDRLVSSITSLAEASHPDDEFMPLVFNNRVIPVLPASTPFTSNTIELRDSLTAHLDVRGKTAFHDALSEALDSLNRGRHERRVLIVLSDGGDNASRLTFDGVMVRVQSSNVVIYSVALVDPLSIEHDIGALRRLAKATGGLAFEPERPRQVGDALRAIAADIRSHYTLAYEPASSERASAKDVGRARRVRVEVHAPDHRGAKVRTRTAYLADTPAPVGTNDKDTQ